MLSSLLGRNAANSFAGASTSFGLQMPCCRMRTAIFRSSSIAVSRWATKSRSRLISRTGTVSPIALSTRNPEACASASSRPRFSCLALKAASARVCCCRRFGWWTMDRAFGIRANPLGFALLSDFRDNRLSCVLARLVFGPVSLLFPLRFVLPNDSYLPRVKE